ncbi:heat stress transcription factor B-4-like protein [Tanacetum coccineum]
MLTLMSTYAFCTVGGSSDCWEGRSDWEPWEASSWEPWGFLIGAWCGFDVPSQGLKKLVERLLELLGWRAVELQSGKIVEFWRLLLFGANPIPHPSVKNLDGTPSSNIDQQVNNLMFVVQKKSKSRFGFRHLRIKFRFRCANQIQSLLINKQHIREKVGKHIWWKIGNGRKVNVWHDTWSSVCPLSGFIGTRDMYDARLKNDCTISEVVKDGKWCWPKDWNNEFNSLQQLQVPVILNEKEDYAVWVNNLVHKMKFKTSDVWKDMCVNDPKVEWYKMIWFSHAIPRHAFVSWLAVQRRLMTQDRVQIWKPNEVMECVFCYKCSDSHNHLFFRCDFTNGIWTEINKRLNIGLSSVWDNIVQEIIVMPMNNNIWSIIRRLVCAAAVYFVWQERNKMMFGKEKRDSEELIKIVIEAVRMKTYGSSSEGLKARLPVQSSVLKIGGNGPESDHFDACLVLKDERSLSLFVSDGIMTMHPICFRFEYIMVENFEGESEPLFYNYLRPLTSLDEGLYALACEEDVCCLTTLVRSFKLIEVYIEHGVTVVDSYIRPSRFKATIEDITDENGSIATIEHRTGKMLCVPHYLLALLTNESVITYTQLSDVQGVDTQDHVIDDVMRQLSFEETELDREADFGDVAGSNVENLDVGRTQEPIMKEVRTQEPIVEESSREDAEQGNGQEDESAPSDGQFFYDDEGMDTACDTQYDVHSSEDAGTDDDDDEDNDFFVDEENEIVKPDVDVHLFGINMDVPFDNIGVTNLVPDDVLEGDDVDVINANGFDSDLGNDDKTSNYRRRRLAELSREIEGVINASSQWKYSFYIRHKFNTTKEAKDRVYLHSIESKRNLNLYKNDSVRVRARCDGKVHIFTMSQGTGPTGLNHGMEAWPSGSNAHDKGDLCPWVLAKSKAEREIRGNHVLQYSMLRGYVVELQSPNPNTTFNIAVERNIDLSLPTRGPFPGQVLAAVGLDSNNGIYPLAYALVEAEKHGYCLQHIDKNMKQGWCGQAYKNLLWRPTSATSVKEFKKSTLELKKMNPKAHEWLNKIPQEHWARSHISGRAKSDLLLNICEVFNGKIVGVNVQSVIDKCTGPLTPTATRIMDPIKREAHLMKAQWNRANKYQVLGSLGDECVVDLVTMTCSCRKWELTWIPCKHVVAAC